MRKLLGWDRYASQETCTAINDLYQHEWRLMMNLFQPSVQPVRRVRVGSRLQRIYDQPQTPLDRLSTLEQGDLAKVADAAPRWIPSPSPTLSSGSSSASSV